MANKTNKRIQNQLKSAGNNVNFKEASAIANKLGVSVDRVYNQTAKTGQNAVAGAAAANAGYVPTPQLKIESPVTRSYVAQVATNTAAQAQQSQPAPAPNEPTQQEPAQQSAVPEFDWQAWNAQMMAQQAAIWESMDAMNAEFIRKQEDWFAQRDALTAKGRNAAGQTTGLPADTASVRRQKRTNKSTTNATATGLNTSTTANSLSLGGSTAGGLSIGKG